MTLPATVDRTGGTSSTSHLPAAAAYIRGVQHSDYPEQPVDGVVRHEIGNRTYVVADVDPLDLDGTSDYGTTGYVITGYYS